MPPEPSELRSTGTTLDGTLGVSPTYAISPLPPSSADVSKFLNSVLNCGVVYVVWSDRRTAKVSRGWGHVVWSVGEMLTMAAWYAPYSMYVVYVNKCVNRRVAGRTWDSPEHQR